MVVHNHHRGSKQQKQKLEGDLILAWSQNVVFTVRKCGTNQCLLCRLPGVSYKLSIFSRVHISYMGFGYRWSYYYLTGKALDMKCMIFLLLEFFQ